MNIKPFLTSLSVLTASSLFAASYSIDSAETYNLSKNDDIVNLYATTGVTDATISVSADYIYYLYIGVLGNLRVIRVFQ